MNPSLACVSVIISPVILGIGNHMSMNVFDHLFWTLSALILIRILKTENTKLWLVLGIVLGLGLQNKHSIFFFGFGLLLVRGFPSIEFISNASLYKNLSLAPREILFGQMTDMHFFLVPILLLGLVFFGMIMSCPTRTICPCLCAGV